MAARPARNRQGHQNDYVNPSIVRKSEFVYNTSSGLIWKEIIEPGNSKQVTKTYGRDGFGNVTSTTVVSEGITRSSSASYGTSDIYHGRSLLSETNSLGHTVRYKYDDEKSQLLSTTDVNDFTTSFSYDPFSTLVRTIHPDATETGEITGRASNASVPTAAPYLGGGQIKFFRAKQTSGSFIAKVYLDSLGRELCSQNTILRNANATGSSRYSTIHTVTKYDSRGRKNAVSQPFAAGETPLFTYIYHDFLTA